MATAILPECTICCDPLSSCLSATPCGHIFHAHCVLRWLSNPKHRKCPQCREQLHEIDLTSLYFSAEVTFDPDSPSKQNPSLSSLSSSYSSSGEISKSHQLDRMRLDQCEIQLTRIQQERIKLSEIV